MKLIFSVVLSMVLVIGLGTAYAQSNDDIVQQWIDQIQSYKKYVEEYKEYMKEYKQWANDRFNYYEEQIKDLSDTSNSNKELSSLWLDEKRQLVNNYENTISDLKDEIDSLNHKLQQKTELEKESVTITPTPETSSNGKSKTTKLVTISTVSGSGFSQDCVNDGCYIPDNITVDVGGKVIFSNTDTTIHTFTAGTVDGFTPSPTGEFDTSIINSGETVEWVPQKAGKVTYYCSLHVWMTGTISVK